MLVSCLLALGAYSRADDATWSVCASAVDLVQKQFAPRMKWLGQWYQHLVGHLETVASIPTLAHIQTLKLSEEFCQCNETFTVRNKAISSPAGATDLRRGIPPVGFATGLLITARSNLIATALSVIPRGSRGGSGSMQRLMKSAPGQLTSP